MHRAVRENRREIGTELMEGGDLMLALLTKREMVLFGYSVEERFR